MFIIQKIPDSRLILCVVFVTCIDIIVLMIWFLTDSINIVEMELYRSVSCIIMTYFM